MTEDQTELVKIILILASDVLVLWILFRVVGAVIQLTSIFLIAALIVGFTLLETGVIAYGLAYFVIYYLGEKYSSAEGSDSIIVTVLGGTAHFAIVEAFHLFVPG